ncbi:MAG: adenosylcobalamin-dependent ribonucleoside-diphosphate reductase [Anaerolineae bacterium]|jgi:ribonucleoside-diphosphate reductase alpha chain|nr:adenosylcobalamin-dependent ribonucleoside-diphosphate reductase [Anaerolineae bacterium]
MTSMDTVDPASGAKGADEALAARFSPNALQVLTKRYLRKDSDGNPVETVAGMFGRIAHHIAGAEEAWGDGSSEAEALFFDLLADMRFVPNSPTFTGAGTPLGQLAACFVLPIEDDMGRDPGGIFQALRDAALIQQTGGGNGFSFSRLRPKNSLVVSSMGRATGPLGFLRVYDKAFGEIAQGGTRRGANMAVLRVDHPDIEEFVSCKTSENAITNFNISVGITDAFMEAVKADAEWELRFPDIRHPDYRGFRGGLEDAEALGIPVVAYKTIQAGDLFSRIVEQAWGNGEPGALFIDHAQVDHPIPALGRYESTNPCGEQFLMPYENCCLGSINLARHLGYSPHGTPVLDWQAIADTAHHAVRFLDDVVTANAYVPAVPQLKEAALRARRIGLGIMGLADVLFAMHISYGSREAQELAAQLMEWIRYHAMLASIDLAQERGPFPAIAGSVYDPQHLEWRPRPWPAWLGGAPSHDWGRPMLDWHRVLEGISRHGIRNATQLTIAPTGTIATVAGIEGYGCEPVFALAYTRYVQEAGGQVALRYVSPVFEAALRATDLTPEQVENILEQVKLSGSCQDVPEVPAGIRDVFVVSGDIEAEGHIRMQAALQLFVDASISKTINLNADATPDDVASAFMLAWTLGCKGLTVYVAGSREKEVLETAATRQQKAGAGAAQTYSSPPTLTDAATMPMPLLHEPIRPRPRSLAGVTYQVQTPLGTAYVTVNLNGQDQPFEVFLNVGKAGSDTAAVAEAIGRLISLTLRLPSPMEPRERLSEVVHQLSGIGGSRSMGFGHNRVLSLPDGVANILEAFLSESEASEGEYLPPQSHRETSQPSLALFQVGDLCPSCGQATLLNTEGCRRCYACGHSEC